jgi:8-oxo-dGTP diphosphatase
MPNTKKLTVVCAIIEQNGRFLAAKRSDAQSHGGFWEFPGGKVDDNEDAQTAIVREIREELGADILVTRALSQTVFAYPDKIVTLIPFVCTLTNNIPAALEHDEIRWIDEAESKALRWLPPDIVILNEYLRTRYSKK